MFFTINNTFAAINNRLTKRFDPHNPLDLPPNTFRVRTNDGNAPNKSNGATYETATLVEGTSDVYDIYKSGTDFSKLLIGGRNITEVLGANTTGITNMSYMFDTCTSLTTVPLFDTSSVTAMIQMFDDCYLLTAVPLFDTSNVTDMSFMFNTCQSLTNVPQFNTSSVTVMKSMFARCYKLTTVPLFDTSHVTDMNSMFYYCTVLTTVPLFDTSNATDMSYMFYNCQSLTSIPLFDTSSVTNMSYMFQYCYKVETGALALYQQASTHVIAPARHFYTFKDCGKNTTTGAAELAQIPSDWK